MYLACSRQDGVREMAALGLPIFLDLKLHDIPNTVAKADRKSTRLNSSHRL